MIKISERKKMKKVFKKGYANEVSEKLNAREIMTLKGNPYSISYITHVFNGRNENPVIEATIIELYTEKVQEAKEISLKKKEIFSTKKPDAGNTGS